MTKTHRDDCASGLGFGLPLALGLWALIIWPLWFFWPF
jgi:hypothetical protein